jgi:hypothetical protein
MNSKDILRDLTKAYVGFKGVREDQTFEERKNPL